MLTLQKMSIILLNSGQMSKVLRFHTEQSKDLTQPLLKASWNNPTFMMTHRTGLCEELLADVGYGTINPWVRIVHLPSDQVRTVSQLRSDDIGLMISIDAVVTKISGVRPRMYSATFKCTSCEHLITIQQPNEQELINPMECSQIDGGCGLTNRQTRFQLLQRALYINEFPIH